MAVFRSRLVVIAQPTTALGVERHKGVDDSAMIGRQLSLQTLSKVLSLSPVTPPAVITHPTWQRHSDLAGGLSSVNRRIVSAIARDIRVRSSTETHSSAA